jgi:hypothetical protein
MTAFHIIAKGSEIHALPSTPSFGVFLTNYRILDARTTSSISCAYDRIQYMIRDRYRQWYLALAKLPIYGEEIDRQVHSYLKGVENIILANAAWRYVEYSLSNLTAS